MRFHMRVARPSNLLEPLVEFYRDILGFELVTRFEGHDGFDGVVLGHRGLSHHLEFTRCAGHTAPSCPSPDHLLAFYIDSPEEGNAIRERLAKRGITPTASFNPYWDKYGTTYLDPDGYPIVLVDGAWRGA